VIFLLKVCESAGPEQWLPHGPQKRTSHAAQKNQDEQHYNN
jgi:hypothetical protein